MTPFEKAKQLFTGKKVLVFGLGLLGGALGDVKFLVSVGADIRVTDKKSANALASTLEQLRGLPVSYHLGEHSEADIDWADIILRNPSIPNNHPLLEYARAHNKQIEMRSSLFAKLVDTHLIGITGTRGKTTTTMMIYELLVAGVPQKKIFLGGNIAYHSDLEMIPLINDPENTYVVMELSSWQLQGFKENCLSPYIAVVTNLYPDHLNSYASLAEYYADKKAIVEFQTINDRAVLNQNQPEFHEWAAHLSSHIYWFSNETLDSSIHLKIPGEHNRANAAAAFQVAEIVGVDNEVAKTVIQNFGGVAYRQQIVGVKHGITYINDTTATTPIAATTALNVYPGSIFICGGTSKNLPTDEFISALNSKVKKIVLLPGNGSDEIKSKISPELLVAEVVSMQEAVEIATRIAVSGDIIVLSPGFTSFGLFNNEFDRGDQFNECVKNLP